jgi:pyruvate formate lyase activating enzyme
MASSPDPRLQADDGSEGVIFHIQRYSIQDGPGIRTTVFLKGCPLRCGWCSNPESQDPRPEIMFRSQQCRKSGACTEVCDVDAITLIDGLPRLDRSRCTLCMDCVEACPSGALEVTGKRMKLEDVVEEACRDEIFYLNSGGGVTLSGGEPLSQPAFSSRFLEACRERSIHTVLDTSGRASWPIMQRALEHTDLVLFDLKHLSAERHLEGTEAGNDLILENLRRTLDAKAANVWIRIPLIPGYNDGIPHLEELARAIGEMGAGKVSLLGFHQWGRSKYRALGREYPFDEVDPLPQESLESAKRLMEARGLTVTIDH